MRRGLVGQNVGDDPALCEFWNNVGAISHQADRDILLLAHCVLQDAQRLVERGDHEIAVARLQSLLDALGININPEKSRACHGRRQWLSAAHSAHAAADDQLACEIAAKMLLARRRKGLKRPLHDSLRADVNPGTGRHLTVHHQPGALEFVELLPIRPMADEV